MYSRNDKAIMSMSEKDLDRFLDKIDFSGECWNWNAYKDRYGYGMFWVKSRVILAHRLACWLRHGPPPEGKPTVDHLCKNTLCVNPDHLRWASYKEQNTFENHDRVKLDDDTVVEAIKSYLKGKHNLHSLARKFDVVPSAVHSWVKGRKRPELLKRAKEELAA